MTGGPRVSREEKMTTKGAESVGKLWEESDTRRPQLYNNVEIFKSNLLSSNTPAQPQPDPKQKNPVGPP